MKKNRQNRLVFRSLNNIHTRKQSNRNIKKQEKKAILENLPKKDLKEMLENNPDWDVEEELAEREVTENPL